MKELKLTLAILAGAFILPELARADDDEKPPEIDPYTRLEEDSIKALGYEKLQGPMVLAETHNDKDVEELIGAKWMLWVETTHFKIGSTLAKRPFPREDPEFSDRILGDFKAMRKKLSRIPSKPKEIDAWLTLHLYAHSLESLYEDFCQTLKIDRSQFPDPKQLDKHYQAPANPRSSLGPYLGGHGKFVVLLFEQEANLARYLSRYLNLNRDKSMRYFFTKSDAQLFATARSQIEKTSPKPFQGFHCHVTSNLIHNFVAGYRGYTYNLPMWWAEGLAHWYTRHIDREYFSATVAEGDDPDYREDFEWEAKVYARVKNRYYPDSASLFQEGDPSEFEFADHLMAWSRVDFLLERKPGRGGAYLDVMKSLPWTAGLTHEVICAKQPEALQAGWELDYESLDAAWVKWVMKEYHPKRAKKRKRRK